MKIKKINLNIFKNADVELFYFLRRLLFKHRERTYIALFFIIVIGLLPRIPYFNIFVTNHQDIINVTIVPLLLAIIIGLNGKNIVLISLTLFLPLALFTLLGKDATAEQLANVAYGLLSIGLLIMFINYVREKDA